MGYGHERRLLFVIKEVTLGILAFFTTIFSNPKASWLPLEMETIDVHPHFLSHFPQKPTQTMQMLTASVRVPSFSSLFLFSACAHSSIIKAPTPVTAHFNSLISANNFSRLSVFTANVSSNDTANPEVVETSLDEMLHAGMEAEGLVYTLEEGLSAVGFGKFQTMVLFYAGFGWFTEAMEIMILSFVGPAVKSQWGLSSVQETLLTTVVFAGELIGAYSWGLISDNYGRRKAFFYITMITSGVGLLSAFSLAYSSLLILRFVAGIGLGGGHVFLSWFLEFIPASHRGKWMVIFTTFWTVGTVFEALLAWLVMPRLNWRWLLGLSAIPSFVLLLFYGLAPESPRYLYMKGKKTEAHQILEKMASLNQTELPPGIFVCSKAEKVDGESLPSEHTPLLSATRKKFSAIKSGFSSFFMLFSSKLISTTLLLWILFFGHTFSYYGIVLLTSELSAAQSECGSTILHSEYLQSDNLYINVLLTSIAELPGLLLSALMVDKLGRKLSMGIMLSLSSLFLLPLVLGQSGIMTTALLFGARMCSIGSFTVACIYAPELYPTSVRTTGSGVANAMGRIGGMMCPLVAVGLVTSCHLKEAIFLFEVVIASTALCILLFKFETKGRELSETLAESDPKADVSGGL